MLDPLETDIDIANGNSPNLLSNCTTDNSVEFNDKKSNPSPIMLNEYSKLFGFIIIGRINEVISHSLNSISSGRSNMK